MKRQHISEDNAGGRRAICWPSSAASACLLGVLGLGLMGGLGACETVVEVAPPPHTPELVAQSFFTRGGGWAVRVTHTLPFTAAGRPGYIDDATVEIWDGGTLVARPLRADSGTYVVEGLGALEGKTYALHVSAPGYADVEGRDALPRPPPVRAFTETALPPPDNNPRRRQTHVELTLADPAGEANHYGLFVMQARWSENRVTGQQTPLPPTLFTFESENPVFAENAFDLLITDQIPYREAFFSDTRFDGEAYTLDFDVLYDEPNPAADLAIRRVLFVVLLSVSDDFYGHWTTAGQQAFTNENPFAEPLRVHSNMSRGYGVFAGFQYRVFPIGVDTVRVGGYGLADVCRLLSGALPVCAPVGGP